MKAPVFTLLLASIIVVRFLVLLDTMGKTDRFIASLPSQIETEGLLMRETRTGILNGLIPDYCGINVIRITDATAERLKNGGLTFLKEATRSRWSSRPDTQTVFYEPWRTITPSQSIGDSFVMSVMSCTGSLNIPFHEIIAGIKSGSGFVSSGRGPNYYLLPDQRLFVHVFMD